MPVGKIEKLKTENGYGFIRSEDNVDTCFFHMSYLVKGYSFNALREGDIVEFELRPSKKKPGQQEAFDVLPKNIMTVPLEIEHPKEFHKLSPPPSVLPYGFVPINIKHAITDEPVLHDGSSGGNLLSGEILCELEALTPLLPGNARYTVSNARTQWGFQGLDTEKQIAEPLRLTDGRVVIAGSALKGMIRQSLGALTSAPMERVGERRFTYRPNFGHADYPGYVCRPAVVERQDGEEWIVKVLPGARDACFRAGQKPADAVEFIYRGGIDGKGILAASAPRQTYVYKKAWISSAKLKQAEECRISKSVFDAYLRTQCILSSDHINTSHPQTLDREKVERAIKDATKIELGQLIYVEKKAGSDEIVSLGHHYQYRWAYTSSIREKNGQPRACLTSLPSEQQHDNDGKPERLTGARLLFGYVHDDKTKIGKGVHERLAGRIAINHAVSDGIPHFLGAEKAGYCIPLKILGQPKPSAWEFYLQQPSQLNAPVNTYGDLPSDPGGELAGRKFYRHQPHTTQADIEAGDTDTTQSKQATLARFICQPGTRFRFTIRFARLRPWELGALLAVLEPHLISPNEKPDEYAHKLGLGRPLGMGSVRITRQAVRIRIEKETVFLDKSARDSLLKEALQALQERLNDDQVQQWLSAHQFVADRRLEYPLHDDGTIYGWHTTVRRDYSKLRRQQSPVSPDDWSKLASKIRSKR